MQLFGSFTLSASSDRFILGNWISLAFSSASSMPQTSESGNRYSFFCLSLNEGFSFILSYGFEDKAPMTGGQTFCSFEGTLNGLVSTMGTFKGLVPMAKDCLKFPLPHLPPSPRGPSTCSECRMDDHHATNQSASVSPISVQARDQF